MTRAIGKKVLSQMTYFDPAVVITMGAISGAYVTGISKGPMVLISPVILALCAIITDAVATRSLGFGKLVNGEPVVVMQNGRILKNNMDKARYDLTMLQAQLRIKGVFDLADVEFAILEPQGQLSVLRKSQKLPLTPSDLNIPTTYLGIPTELVRNGDIIDRTFYGTGLVRAGY